MVKRGRGEKRVGCNMGVKLGRDRGEVEEREPRRKKRAERSGDSIVG